jgi:hypothetical protein
MLVSGILGKGWRSRILTINLPVLLDRWNGATLSLPFPRRNVIKVVRSSRGFYKTGIQVTV